ncbi:GlxA family transcriptional regulator [Hahella sp. HN01]|uniref:GlxA family transcriptional regulator n=1 Tax=unclassified Hahella TaxID=2624107 RepID=UPI001C1EE4E0|nr:helix-turn-helix domain-containing protein [Hahella sp. HN01]MBU6954765.1 helix-turn-helix domain-containing protein [Hahella sp. HN01]
MTPLKIGFLLFPDTHLLDLSGPAQALRSLSDHRPGHVELVFFSPAPSVASYQGVTLSGLASLPADDVVFNLLIVNGSKYKDDMISDKESQQGLRWLQNYAQRYPQAAIASVCTGAFYLARAGLLRNRHCTTHHGHVDSLRLAEPSATVLENRLYVCDGPIITSAGVTTGTDMILAWMAETFDDDLAQHIARELVIYARRDGEQAQISERRRYRNHLDHKVHRLQDRISAAPELPWTAGQLEREINLGYRQLTRRFRLATGVSIKQYQLILRLEVAQKLMREGRHANIERLAETVGFQSAHAFRKAWKNRFGAPPSAYEGKE